MFKRATISVLVFSLWVINVSSQSAVSSPVINLYQTTPSTPTAAGLSKYFEFPVNMATGLPAIQIPLYTIHSGNIQLPISLSYHAGGVKVDEIAGNVGMNWSLNAGGIINRRINGLDDFYGGTTALSGGTYMQPNYLVFTGAFNNVPDIIDSFGATTIPRDQIDRLVGRIADGIIDGETDEYIYSTPGGNGTIFYDQRSQVFKTDQRNGWKAYHDASNPSITGGKWTINSDKLAYHFDYVEEMKNPLLLKPQLIPPGAFVNQPKLPSAWYLTTVSDGIHNKSVTFNYTKIWRSYAMGYSESRLFTFDGYYAGGEIERNEREGDEVSISSITFDNGNVQFIYDTEARLDGGPKAIKEIRVQDAVGSVIKRFLLTYFYDTSRLANNTPDMSSRILFLESIQEISVKNGDTLKKPPYKFVYNFNKHVPKRFSFAQDTWGYYNGKHTNTSLVPDDILQAYGTTHAGTGGHRTIDTVFAKAGLIKELYYPTGGKALFEFEGNMESDELTGGLRIKRIVNYDPVSQSSLQTEYSYTNNRTGQGSGQRLFSPKYYYYYIDIAPPNSPMILKVEGQSIYPLYSYQGSPVIYTEVEKKVIGNNGIDLLSRHYFTLPTILSDIAGDGVGVPHNRVVIDNYAGGMELMTEIYRKNANNTYSLVRKDSSVLETLNNYNEYTKNIQAAWAAKALGIWARWPGNDPYHTAYLNMDLGTSVYKAFRESTVPKQQFSISYDDTIPLISETYFTYDNDNSNNRVIKTLNSVGDTIIKVTKYANDYTYFPAGSTDWNYQIGQLLSSSPVETLIYIKKKNSNDSLLTKAILLEYSNNRIKRVFKFHTSVPVNDFVVSHNELSNFHYDGRYQLFEEVEAFDNHGNALTVNSDAKRESYLWDHKGSFMTAVFKDARFQDVAYTSFETDSTGNWSFAGSSITESVVPTGRRAYNLSNGNMSKNSLDNGKTYEVSYWSKTGAQNVNGSAAISGRTANGWTFYIHHSVSPSATAISVSGSGLIDEVRLYPSGSLANTYTYDPLIGVTSQCDENNRIVYYEYDAHGRLSLVRDQDQNIIKKTCYNYAGQPEDCVPSTSGQWQSTGQTRCKSCTANNSYNSGEQEHQELDINIYSTTYNTYRWISDGVQAVCASAADWQNTVTALRCKSGSITGEQEQEQRDINPCSASYNTTRWIVVSTNLGACPVAACNSGNCSGVDKKCINGVCETGVKAYITSVRTGSKPNYQYNNTYVYRWSDCSESATYSDVTTSPVILEPLCL